MNNVFLFEPKSQHDAKKNLYDFIEFAKKLQPLGISQSFESNKWKSGHAVILRVASSKQHIYFTKLKEVNGKFIGTLKTDKIDMMDEPFL